MSFQLDANHPAASVLDNNHELHLEPWVDFDYDALDPIEAPTPEPSQDQIDARASEAVLRLLQWCWTDGDRHTDFRAAFNKFCVLSLAISPDLVRCESFRELAERLGFTKQYASKLLRELCQEFGAHLGQRSDTGRQHMRAARLRQRGPDGRVVNRKQKAPALDRG